MVHVLSPSWLSAEHVETAGIVVGVLLLPRLLDPFSLWLHSLPLLDAAMLISVAASLEVW